jgi:hypothetical protein
MMRKVLIFLRIMELLSIAAVKPLRAKQVAKLWGGKVPETYKRHRIS